MNKVPFSVSWESDNFVYTASAMYFPLKGQQWVLGVMGRFTPYPEDEDAFCATCQSRKVSGELFLAIAETSQVTTGHFELFKTFIPIDFCAGTFIRIQREFTKEISQLLSSEKTMGPRFSESIDKTVCQLTRGEQEALQENIIGSFTQDMDHVADRRQIFCEDAIELPKNLHEALLRSIQRKGPQGYYLQKGLSELFKLINQQWPSFGIFWPSEVGAVGKAQIQGADIIINLQLMEVHYRLAQQNQAEKKQ